MKKVYEELGVGKFSVEMELLHLNKYVSVQGHFNLLTIKNSLHCLAFVECFGEHMCFCLQGLFW
jgi:hypothetical protein